MPRQMNLNVFATGTGYLQEGWRMPEAQPDRILTLDYFAELAETCEAAKLDAIFFADVCAFGQAYQCPYDALTLISGAGRTDHAAGLDCDVLDDLLRAVPARAQVRFAR